MTLPLKNAYNFADTYNLGNEISSILGKPRGYKGYIRRGYIVKLFQEKNIFNEFCKKYWPYGNTPAGEERCHIYQQHMEDENLVTDEPDEDEDAQEARNLSFALESHLRDFLANNGNLSIIEGGLNLDKTEFSIDNGRGRIDILAVDKNDKYVVIELKLSQGRNKTLGQLIYYMGWVDKEIGKDKKPCRGIIIAKEISPDLSLAVSRVPGVSLFRYSMSFQIEAV